MTAAVIAIVAWVGMSFDAVGVARAAPFRGWSKVTSLAVESTELAPPMPLGQPGVGLATIAGLEDPSPALTLDRLGGEVLVWNETVTDPVTFDPRQVVRVAESAQTGGWAASVTLDELREGEQGETGRQSPGGWAPQVTVAGNGRAIAVWEGAAQIRAAVRSAGGEWKTESLTPPRSEPFPAAEEPQVASDQSGDAVAVWPREANGHNARGYTTGIEAAEMPASGAFAQPKLISRSEEAWNPRVALNARGDVLVAWNVYGHSRCLVRAAFRRAAGAWSPAQTVSGSEASCKPPQVALGASGEGIVMWGTRKLEVAELREDGSWSPSRVIAHHFEEFTPPQLAMSENGDVVVEWCEDVLETREPAVWTRSRLADGKWQPPRRFRHSRPGKIALAIDARGDVLTLWGRRHGIEIATRPHRGRWARTRLPLRPAANVEARLDSSGDATIIWRAPRAIESIRHPRLFD